MSIATIKKEAYVDEVIIGGGDNIQHSVYLYRIYYLDDTYAYMDTAQSQGLAGNCRKSAYKYAQDGGYTGTEAQFTESLAIAGDIESYSPVRPASLPTTADTSPRQRPKPGRLLSPTDLP